MLQTANYSCVMIFSPNCALHTLVTQMITSLKLWWSTRLCCSNTVIITCSQLCSQDKSREKIAQSIYDTSNNLDHGISCNGHLAPRHSCRCLLLMSRAGQWAIALIQVLQVTRGAIVWRMWQRPLSAILYCTMGSWWHHNNGGWSKSVRIR